MPSLRLPPLPPPATWGSHFVRTNIASSPDPITHRSFPNRVLLANRDISDQFVRALGIRPNEVVLETFAGNGCLTRSLLHGGNPENTAEISAAWSAQKESGVTEPPNDGAMDFPTWKAELASHESTPSTLSDTPLPTPRLVIACEPSPDFLVRGLGMPKSQIPPRIGIPQTIHGKAQASESSDKDRRHTTAHIESSQYVATVHQSTFEPNLLLSPTTPYVWETVPSILSNELVASKLERYSPTNNNSRPWSAPAPPITLVAQMADSSVSDQMLAQWIASAIGADSKPSWIWAWGRVRLAMLLPSQSYDVSFALRSWLCADGASAPRGQT